MYPAPESTVFNRLMENADGLLPLGSDVRAVALVGPNADDVYGQLGDWSFGS